MGNAGEVKKFVTQRVPKAHFLQTPLIIVYQAQSGCRIAGMHRDAPLFICMNLHVINVHEGAIDPAVLMQRGQ